MSQRNGKRRGTKKRNEISAAAFRLKKTSFHLNSTRDTVFSVVSCAYRLHNKLNQLWGKISSWLFCVLLWVFFPRTEGRFSKSHILAFTHFKRFLIHIQPQRKISISVAVWQLKIFYKLSISLFSTLILVFIKTSLFTLLVWKNSDFRYPLQDHFPALQPGGELNPLPVWRRSTELLKLYRSTELVQCALSSHRHHWDCRAPGSGSAAWNTKEIINCTMCSISLVPFTSSYRWGRSTKAPGLLQSPWALCSSLHLLEVQL